MAYTLPTGMVGGIAGSVNVVQDANGNITWTNTTGTSIGSPVKISPGISGTTNVMTWGGSNMMTLEEAIYKISQLENDIRNLKDELKERVHINVAKAQEERLVQLEEALTDIIDERQKEKAIIEEKEAKLKKSQEDLQDGLSQMNTAIGSSSSGWNTHYPVPPTPQQVPAHVQQQLLSMKQAELYARQQALGQQAEEEKDSLLSKIKKLRLL